MDSGGNMGAIVPLWAKLKHWKEMTARWWLRTGKKYPPNECLTVYTHFCRA